MASDEKNCCLQRRRFLKLGLALPMLTVNLLLPESLLAANKKVALNSIPMPARKPRAPRILMIDPGHGGHDPGCIGISGTYEKHVTIDVARRLADSLGGKAGITPKLTRDTDIFLPLEERVRLGREAHADMFISIHADSAPTPAAHGLSVYTLSEKASDKFSKELADHENRADRMGGIDLPPADKEVTAILLDLATRQTHNTALHTKASFVQGLKGHWPLLERPMRSANFVVLRAPDIPSMLIETGFLSNPRDEKVLREPWERAKIAKLMAANLADILNSDLFG